MAPENYSEENQLPEQETAPEELNETPELLDENGEDPLKRHTKFSWKSFGGDGFLISVLFHAVLIIFALFYVVATVVPKEEEQPAFVSGAGGGNNGDNANRQNRRMKPKARDLAKTQNKITSKSANATLTLPEMPVMNNTMSMGAGARAGGDSSGFGGGAGGGIGKGTGPGIGNGRNFLSAFGTKFSGAPSLRGTLYDLKRSRDGKVTYATIEGNNAGKRKEELHRALTSLVKRNFSTTELNNRYFKAPVKLAANQLYIYKDPKTKGQYRANAATQAFADENGKEPFKAPGWMVVYEGTISPPETGEYRFLGMGDDVMLVGVQGKPALYAYWPKEGHGPAVPYQEGWEPKNHCGKGGTDGAGSGSGGGLQDHLFKGQWIKLFKGQRYKICIAFGEGAGGYMGAALGIEKKDSPNPNGKISLFKLSEINPDLFDILFIEGKYTATGPNFSAGR